MIIYENNVDYRLIAEKVKRFLEREEIRYADFEAENSPDLDRLAVSFEQQIPVANVPVRFRIEYDSSYGEDCFFSASADIPRGAGSPGILYCRNVALKYNEDPEMTVSFEGHAGGKWMGTFHIIRSVIGRHATDTAEMKQQMDQVRDIASGIVCRLLSKGVDEFVSGECNKFSTTAQFEQLDSMFEDDRVILTDTRYMDTEDTLDLTEILKNAAAEQEKGE